MGDEGRKAYSDFCLKPALLQGSRRWVTGGPDLAPLEAGPEPKGSHLIKHIWGACEGGGLLPAQT